MGIKIEKRETEFSKLFPDDMDLYYGIMERYVTLTSENFMERNVELKYVLKQEQYF
jgi:hypothetical protein